jgi:hypothetical protein
MGPEVRPTLLALHRQPALRSDIGSTNCSRPPCQEWQDLLKPQRVFYQEPNDLTRASYHLYPIRRYMASRRSPLPSYMLKCKLTGPSRRKHRRIAMQSLNSKAVGARISALDHEASNLVQSLLLDTRGGASPVDPSHYVGRYVLKSVSAPRLVRA